MKKHIPNSITAGNLICGCFAIVNAFEGDLYLSAYLIIAAMIFDFFDGFAARLLNVSGELGKQLDSLADMVSFGVAPGIILYQFTKMLQETNPVELLTNYPWLLYLAFFIPVFSALRLAKFNIDTRQSDSFIGLPTPANASFFVFCVLVYHYTDLFLLINIQEWVLAVISNPMVMLATGVIFSLLLTSEVPMFSLKLKTLKWKENELVYTFLGVSVLLLLLINIIAAPIIIILYILWSITSSLLKKVADK